MNLAADQLWRWGRGALALLLAVLFGMAGITYNGFTPGSGTFIVVFLLVAVAVIWVGIWKQWDLEIVGWTLLAVFLLGMMLAGT